jgi:adenylate cyclase
VYSDADVEALSLLRTGVERFGLDAVLQLSRVLGTSLARIAEAEAMTVMVGEPDTFLPTASSTMAAAQASAELSGLLTNAAQAYDVLHRRHLAAALRRLDATVAPEARSAEVVDVAVGFADLVGFSGLGERLDLRSFADAVRDFAAIASDVVATGGGRVVKLIGDEVMFVAPDATRAVGVGLELLEAFGAHPVLPPVRAAVAAGRVVGCDGDYFGPVVNTAARLVELAEAGILLVNDAVASAVVGERFELEALGAPRLRGVERPVEAFRVRARSAAE